MWMGWRASSLANSSGSCASVSVSSAGIFRVLRTDAHLRFAAEHGLPVTASAYMPVFAGARQHTGRIESFDAQTLRFEGGISVERKAVARLEAEC